MGKETLQLQQTCNCNHLILIYHRISFSPGVRTFSAPWRLPSPVMLRWLIHKLGRATVNATGDRRYQSAGEVVINISLEPDKSQDVVLH